MTPPVFNFDNTYQSLPGVFYSKLSPIPVPGPELVILNEKLAEELGLDFSRLSEEERAALFAGNLIPDEADPLAQAYAGHQFGNFTLLGDGRAVALGEQISPAGERFDVQFKGSGRTPYSRGGDGRAALGPMLREYVISEAMHALGIPTTRSLAVVTTGEKVFRENELPGSILTRIARSHIRVGTFEFASLHEDKAITQALLEYLIDRHFPQIKEEKNQALALLELLIEQQAELISQWMRVGFIHGVMNTDNMALSGETIDYGPCAFMDAFHPDTVFSSIDRKGRYAYANQPIIAQWNLARLAESLLPLFEAKTEKAIEMAESTLNGFEAIYKKKWTSMMRAKIGLLAEHPEDLELVTGLLDLMKENSADFCNTFRHLSEEKLPSGELFENEGFGKWHTGWKTRLEKEGSGIESSRSLMKATNPAVIPRNHKVEEVLKAGEEGNLNPLHDLLRALEKPYRDRDELKPYQSPPQPEEKVLQTFCGT